MLSLLSSRKHWRWIIELSIPLPALMNSIKMILDTFHCEIFQELNWMTPNPSLSWLKAIEKWMAVLLLSSILMNDLYLQALLCSSYCLLMNLPRSNNYPKRNSVKSSMKVDTIFFKESGRIFLYQEKSNRRSKVKRNNYSWGCLEIQKMKRAILFLERKFKRRSAGSI